MLANFHDDAAAVASASSSSSSSSSAAQPRTTSFSRILPNGDTLHAIPQFGFDPEETDYPPPTEGQGCSEVASSSLRVERLAKRLQNAGPHVFVQRHCPNVFTLFGLLDDDVDVGQDDVLHQFRDTFKESLQKPSLNLVKTRSSLDGAVVANERAMRAQIQREVEEDANPTAGRAGARRKLRLDRGPLPSLEFGAGNAKLDEAQANIDANNAVFHEIEDLHRMNRERIASDQLVPVDGDDDDSQIPVKAASMGGVGGGSDPLDQALTLGVAAAAYGASMCGLGTDARAAGKFASGNPKAGLGQGESTKTCTETIAERKKGNDEEKDGEKENSERTETTEELERARADAEKQAEKAQKSASRGFWPAFFGSASQVLTSTDSSESDSKREKSEDELVRVRQALLAESEGFGDTSVSATIGAAAAAIQQIVFSGH